MKRILILIGLFLTLGWRCYEKFSISGLQSFLSHLKAYELRAASIFLVTVTIGLIHVIPLKKNLILRVLPFWWNILTILALFIYPITSDFANRFGKLTTENGAEFLAVILPVFLMMGVLSSLPSPWKNEMDKEERQERKTQLSNFLKAPHLTKSRRNEHNTFGGLLVGYGFLSFILLWRLDALNKIPKTSLNEIAIRPLAIFLIWSLYSLDRNNLHTISAKNPTAPNKKAKKPSSQITLSSK